MARVTIGSIIAAGGAQKEAEGGTVPPLAAVWFPIVGGGAIGETAAAEEEVRTLSGIWWDPA